MFLKGALIGAGASLIGGLLGSSSASKGIRAQEAAAARSDALQKAMYDQTRADNAPTRERGDAAGNRLSYLMGLTGGATGSPAAPDRAKFTTSRNVMTDAGYSGGGGEGGNNDRSPTWSTVQDFNQSGYDAAVSAQAQQAQQAQAARESDPEYGSLSRNFSEAAPELRKFGQADYENDFVAQSGLQFGADEGRKGIERQQQASGGLLSGATLKALTRFGTDYGTKNVAGAYDRFNNDQDQGYGRYTDKLNRFNTDQGTQYNRLASIAGTGQAATGQVGAAGQNFANQASQTAQGLGNAQAAAGIARGNAWGGAVQGVADSYQQNRMIEALRGGSGIGKYGGSSNNPSAANYTNSFDRM